MLWRNRLRHSQTGLLAATLVNQARGGKFPEAAKKSGPSFRYSFPIPLLKKLRRSVPRSGVRAQQDP